MADKYVQLHDADGNNLYPVVADFPLGLQSGGTGADNATDARSNLGLDAAGIASLFTVYTAESSGTSSSNPWTNFEETKTVHGNGLVFISVGVETDDTNTYGTTGARINKGSVCWSANIIRYPSAYSQRQAVSACCWLSFSDGETFSIQLGSTRGGTKYYKRNYVCLGCTLT